MKKILVLYLLLPLSVVYGRQWGEMNPKINPTASFSVDGGLSHCFLDTVKLINQSSNYTSLYWDFGDGYNTYVENPIHIYEAPGDYSIRLTAINVDPISNQVTRAEFTLNIEINPGPDLQMSPKNDTTILAGQLLSLCVSGTYSQVTWSTGELSDCIDITKSGRYWCVASDEIGCTASDTSGLVRLKTPTVSDSSEIQIINNILTPNSDGRNDWFFIKDYEDYEFPIKIILYNIWGEVVFQSDAYENNWDGTKNNTPLDAGTYYYHIRSDGKKDAIGFIDIIR